MEQELRILVAAGGTGGHLFPALAVLRAAERMGKVRACFIGRRDRIEGRLVPALGYEFVALPLFGLGGWKRLRSYGMPFAVGWSVARVWAYVRVFRPQLIMTTGAYHGVPAGIVARLCGTPLVVVEVNRKPGRAVRLLARWADVLATGYEETAEVFPERVRRRIHCFGVPVREEFFNIPSAAEARRRLGLQAERPAVVVLGGSLGAARLNAVAQRLLPYVEAGVFQLIWQHGERFAVPARLPRGVLARPFFEDPALVLAAAECVVARAGGMTIAELCAVGRAALLVPYPGARDQHQLDNARWMEQKGAALCIADDRAELEVPVLLQQLLADEERRQQMSDAARRLARPDAAQQIARLLWNSRGAERCGILSFSC